MSASKMKQGQFANGGHGSTAAALGAAAAAAAAAAVAAVGMEVPPEALGRKGVVLAPPWAGNPDESLTSERRSLLSWSQPLSSDVNLPRSTLASLSWRPTSPREVELQASKIPLQEAGPRSNGLEEKDGEGGKRHSEDREELLRDHHAQHHGPEFSSGTISGGVFNLSTTVIGAGIMGLPATFRVLGLPIGVLLLVCMALLTEVSLEILVKTCTALQRWSYGEIVGAVCGPRSRFILDLSVLMNNLGMCIVYLIIVADVISGTGPPSPEAASVHPGMLAEWGLRSHWWAGRAAIILITMLVFLVPLAVLKHVDSLKYTSAVAVGSAIFFVGITVTLAVAAGVAGKLQTPRMLPAAFSDGSWLELFSVIPVMATAYTCHYSIHPIYHELNNRSEDRMFAITRVSMIMCTSIYLFTSVSGYLLFGSATAADILINFDSDLGVQFEFAINTAIRASYVLHIVLVFPIIFYSLRGTTDSLLFPNAEEPVTESNLRFYSITAGGLLVTYFGAVVVPNIWVAFEITGATGTMLLSFFFPALLALRDKTGVITSKQLALARFMLVFSVFVSVTGLTTSIINIVRH